MNSLKVKFLGSFTALLIAFSFSFAANADITLQLIEGKKFTDFEMADQSRTKSLETLEKNLNKLFSSLSEDYLKDDQKMEVDITNIDLPGIIRYSYGSQHRDIRVVKENSPFKLYFNYRIINNNGEMVKEGEYKIKEFSDLGFVAHKRRFRGNVGYYEQPLKKWFKTAFVD